jgi:hypothetical protein
MYLIKIYKSLLASTFDVSPNDWIIQSISGAEKWEYNTTDKVMKINARVSIEDSGIANEDWLISPSFNLTNTVNPLLLFSSRTRFIDAFTANTMSLWITNNFTGDASTSDWKQIDAKFDTNNSYSSFAAWVSSDEINLLNYVSNYSDVSKVRIAFKYNSTGNSEDFSTHWEIDNVNITDK